jgi:hypothetical protein
MSRATIVSKSQLVAGATAIAVVGFLAAAPAVQADPAKCTQYGFDGLFNVRGDNGWTVDFNSTGPNAAGAATVHFYDGGTVNGNISRGGVQGNVVDFAIQWNDKPNNIWNFHGTVSDDALVHDGGESLGSIPSGYTGEVTSGWHSTTPLKCMDAPPPAAAASPPPSEQAAPQPAEPPANPPDSQSAPKQGPLVSAEPGIGGVTFHITDRSGVASQCTYSSEGFETSFALPANGSFDLFVPAFPLGKTRTGTVTCDNGTSTNTSVFY